MPGLIGAAGMAEAEAAVRRAARPLLRRPWQELAVLVDPATGAALGFAGERGAVVRHPATGVLLGFDGELFCDGGVFSGTEAAEKLLDLYLGGGALLEPPDGWFAAAVWDPREEAFVLVADRIGHHPLYVARTGGGILVAGELKALVAGGLEPRLDLQAWAEMLAYEHPLGHHAPLEGVRLVEPACALTVPLSGVETLRERWRYQIEPAPTGEEPELAAEFGSLLERAVARRLTPGTALALSGGLDSRCLAAILSELAPDTIAFTYGALGSEDLELGGKVTARADLRPRALPLTAGYIARGAAETVWAGEGHVRCFHAHHLALRSQREADGARALLIGFGGDPVVRDVSVPTGAESEAAFALAFHRARNGCLTDELLEEVLTPSLAAELRGRARASFARYLTEEEGDRRARALQHLFRHNHRRKTLPGALLFSDDLAPRDPFDDADLVEFCRRMPWRSREGGALERAYLRGFPALAALRSPKDGLPPGLTGVRRTLAALGVRARRRARVELDARLGPAWWPYRHGIGDYATDLRQAGADLLGILLEPRTLARRQLREEAVRRLVEETLAGRARHTRALGMLLTLELFQRQFLEGEAPTPQEAAAGGS